MPEARQRLAGRSGLLSPLLCLALLTAVPCVEAGRKEAASASLEQVQSRIEALNKELDEAREAHSDAADALKQSERAISDTNRSLYELNRKHRDNRKALEALRQQKSGMEHTVLQQQQRLAELLHQQYLHGQQGYLQVVLSQQDPAAIARDLHYMRYVARARNALITSLRSNLGQVARLNQKTADTLQEIAGLKAEQERQRQALRQQQKEKQGVLSKLAQQIKQQRGEISKLRRDEKRLTSLLERLARIVPQAPRKSEPATRSAPRKNEELPSADLADSSFSALKGKLRLPVRGEIANRFGAAREDSGISWKGLFIRAGDGEEVKSVASGRVVFADWLRGFGNLLIVDHGSGYMSLYGNNQALLKKIGDSVSPGDTVATVGNSGGNAESGVYFELRHRSKPLDPMSWSVLR
ncbi:MAG: peptidase M23 [Methylobacterium sp.]|nr:peptidase M23 [Methylobacterium sp.]